MTIDLNINKIEMSSFSIPYICKAFYLKNENEFTYDGQKI